MKLSFPGTTRSIRDNLLYGCADMKKVYNGVEKRYNIYTIVNMM